MHSVWKWVLGIGATLVAALGAIASVLFLRGKTSGSADLLNREAEDILEGAKKDAEQAIDDAVEHGKLEWEHTEERIEDEVQNKASSSNLPDIMHMLSKRSKSK